MKTIVQKCFYKKDITHSDDSNDSNEKIPKKKVKCTKLYLKNEPIDHQSS